MLQKQHN